MEKLKVLIAEDDPLTLRLLQKLLTGWGYEVTPVYDGESARRQLQEGGIRICILDWEMPELNGCNLCQWIHSTSLDPVPYVILLTARGNPQSICDGFAAGADDYITKPFDPNDLRYRLATLALRVMKSETVGEEFHRPEPIDIYRINLGKFRKELSLPV